MSKVTLEVVREIKDPFEFSTAVLARQVIREVLKSENCPLEVDCCLTLTDAEGIHQINLEYRGIDRPTDVLSFPGIPLSTPSDWEQAQANRLDCTDPETGHYYLGDIILNCGQVLSQAEEYGHSIRREFAFLIAHSALHLCGYDHMTPNEAEVMEDKQEKILQTMGITRD